jgi:hypothetical protein
LNCYILFFNYHWWLGQPLNGKIYGTCETFQTRQPECLSSQYQIIAPAMVSTSCPSKIYTISSCSPGVCPSGFNDDGQL